MDNGSIWFKHNHDSEIESAELLNTSEAPFFYIVNENEGITSIAGQERNGTKKKNCSNHVRCSIL